MPFVSINPATETLIKRYPAHTKAQIEARLSAAAKAAILWRATPFARRAAVLRRAARLLRANADSYGRLITAEMGKPLKEAVAEVQKCALGLEYFAGNGARLLKDEVPEGAPEGSRIVHSPLGTILAIMPWNFPFWQGFRAAAPALMAGNTILLKHAPNVSGCALAMEGVFRKAGAPKGIFLTLLVGTEAIPRLLADRRVAAVTLTGSVRAGKSVAQAAGVVMKKAVFELGGSDPYLVLADADIPKAAEIAATARLQNMGQSCICAKRFIVVRPVARAFTDALVARMSEWDQGDPLSPLTQLGPMARADLRQALDRQVRQSVAKGAVAALGGRVPKGTGFFYPPTVLTHVKPGMPAYHEELFGPVASVIVARDETDAIRIANDSVYGLGSGVFTRSARTAERVAQALEAGMVAVNSFVKSDPPFPFGGVKHSGHGRELGAAGIREFVNIKTIRIA